MKYFSSIFWIMLFFLFFQCVNAQRYAHTKTEVHLLKYDFTGVKNIDDATYLLHIVKQSDIEYVCRYYNKFDPMLKQETFPDSGFSIPNGSFLGYGVRGILDSEAVVYRGRKTSLTFFDGSLKTTAYIKYRNGNVYEKKDYINNIYTDNAGHTYNLAEKAKRDSLLQFKKTQVDTNQIDLTFQISH